jgi:hypothetical protein
VSVTAWFLQGLHILRLRQGPQDLPAGQAWTGLAAACYLAAGAALLSLREWAEGRLIGVLLLDLVMLVAFTGVVLAAVGRGPRLMQTLQALLLVGTWFSLIALPVATVSIDPEADPDLLTLLVVSFSVTLLLWSIAVMGHVFRHALEWSFQRGLMLALVYSALNIVVHYQVFPID